MREINVAICALVSLVLFILSFMQFRERGPILNNSMLVSEKRERSKDNLKRWYRQSAIVFLILAFVFLFMGLWVLTDLAVFAWLMGAAILAVLVYAFTSKPAQILTAPTQNKAPGQVSGGFAVAGSQLKRAVSFVPEPCEEALALRRSLVRGHPPPGPQWTPWR